MRSCKMSCTFGPQYDQCCVACERYPECTVVFDYLDEYEYTENCPYYAKEEADET